MVTLYKALASYSPPQKSAFDPPKFNHLCTSNHISLSSHSSFFHYSLSYYSQAILFKLNYKLAYSLLYFILGFSRTHYVSILKSMVSSVGPLDLVICAETSTLYECERSQAYVCIPWSLSLKLLAYVLAVYIWKVIETTCGYGCFDSQHKWTKKIGQNLIAGSLGRKQNELDVKIVELQLGSQPLYFLILDNHK